MGMNSVADLVQDSAITHLATPANFRHGQEIADTNGVTFTEFSPFRVAAHVSGPATQPRNTLLESTDAGLHWQCSCSNNKALFCKHLVATALQINRRASHHHS
jgi:uncharacterized Zn finger protein